MKNVLYRCPDHGLFKVPQLFGGGWGPARDEERCPECVVHGIHKPYPRGKRVGKEKVMRQIAVSKDTHDKLQKHCNSNGISMSAWIASLVEGL